VVLVLLDVGLCLCAEPLPAHAGGDLGQVDERRLLEGVTRSRCRRGSAWSSRRTEPRGLRGIDDRDVVGDPVAVWAHAGGRSRGGEDRHPPGGLDDLPIGESRLATWGPEGRDLYARAVEVIRLNVEAP
jgi:hypothetical protein